MTQFYKDWAYMCGHKHRFCKNGVFFRVLFPWVPNKLMKFLGHISMHSRPTPVKFLSYHRLHLTPHTPTRKGGEGLDWRRRIQEQYFPELFSGNTLSHFWSCHLPAPGICWPQSHVSYGDTITSGHLTKVCCTPKNTWTGYHECSYPVWSTVHS